MGKSTLPFITLVERQSQIADLCRQCQRERTFAFDTEFVMEDRYATEVCLIQIATADSVTLIDPFRDVDLQPIWQLICDDQVESVVHAGQEDLALCVQHTGEIPCRIFDTQLAAGFVGPSYPMSLQKLAQSMLHVRLHKSKTLTDWRKRPLTQEQIRYAAEDVMHLLPLRARLRDRLTKLKRLKWVEEEFRRFEDVTLYRRVEEDKLKRLKGAGSLTGQQLAIVRELMAWREALAKKLNRPARVVLRDHLLVEIGKLGLSTFQDIRDLRGLNLRDREVQGMARVVQIARQIPQDQWPARDHRRVEPPCEAALTSLITAVLRSYCLERNLAYSLVATQKSIQELLRHNRLAESAPHCDIQLLQGWRGQAVGGLLLDILSGRKLVGVDQVNGETVVRVTSGQTESG